MFFQRILAWALLLAAVAAAAYGIASGGLLAQPVWTPQGASGMAAFAGLYILAAGLLVWFAPRWFAPALGVAVVGYSLVAAGPLAVASVVLVLVASYAAGVSVLRSRPEAPVASAAGAALLGLGIWAAIVALTAGLKIHYWPVYLVLFLGAIAWAWTWRFLRLPRLAWQSSRESAFALALPAFPFLVHWLAALKPEVGADALAIHLTVPARMAAHHHWPFDVMEFAWALKPMTGEWTFTLAYLFGGEAGARLLNVALAALLCWLLYGWLRDLLPARDASLLAAAFASTPLVHEMAGSLHPESVAAAMLAGALYFLRQHLKTAAAAPAFAAALLTGVAASTATGALAFAAVLALAACLTVEWPALLKSAPLALLTGLLPYWRAWNATGNPVFPHLSGNFRSTLFEGTLPEINDRGIELTAGTGWYDLFFHSSRFLEGFDGGLGFLCFLLAPLCLIAFRPNWPKIAFVLPVVWTAGFLMVVAAGGRAESLYAGFPAVLLSMGVMLATFRLHSAALPRAILGVTAAAFAMQMCLLPAASPAHRDFALNQVLRPETVDEYLAVHAPAKPLVRELSRLAPAARALWLDSNAVAGFAGPVLTNTWHHPLFLQRLRDATSSEGLLFAAQEMDIDYFVAPSPESSRPLTSVFFREFLDIYSQPAFRFADFELRKFEAPDPGLVAEKMAYAPPGRHDEVNSYVRYEGAWRRTFEFPEAYRGTLTYANDVRARILIRFRGSAITVLHTAAANRCTGLLTLDDTVEEVFPQYSADTEWQASGPRLQAAPGYHTLVIRLPQARTTTTSLSECYLDFDGFIVE
jgi:hypothetical protein